MRSLPCFLPFPVPCYPAQAGGSRGREELTVDGAGNEEPLKAQNWYMLTRNITLDVNITVSHYFL